MKYGGESPYLWQGGRTPTRSCDAPYRLLARWIKIAAHGHRSLRLPPRGLPESQAERQPNVIVHKFQAGQMVKLIPSPYIRNSQGEFEILRVLPEEHGMHQYRIKSTTDGVVRVVLESEIA